MQLAGKISRCLAQPVAHPRVGFDVLRALSDDVGVEANAPVLKNRDHTRAAEGEEALLLAFLHGAPRHKALLDAPAAERARLALALFGSVTHEVTFDAAELEAA